MQVKAVIWRKDRTNDVVVVKKKQIEGKSFRHGNYTYFLHADRFMVTWLRKLGMRKYFATYYYVEGLSEPIPVPDFEMVETPKLDTKGEVVYGKDGKPEMIQTFPKILKSGVESEEMAAIFNPWFYRIIAQQTKGVFEQIQMYLLIGIACGVAYIIFRMHNPVPMSVDDIEGLRALIAGSNSAPGTPVNSAAGG